MRSTDYPTTAKAAVTKQIGAIITRGGRRVVVQNADWRTMQAFRVFQDRQGQRSELAEWIRSRQVLGQLPALRHLLALDRLVKSVGARPATAPVTPPPSPQPPSVAPPAKSLDQGLFVGHSAGLRADPVHVDPAELARHAAFIGSTGSGKTTAALNLIEQLLERGIPVVLVDRKGDLCRYADPAAWEEPLSDSPRAAQRRRLRERLDIAIYTPGRDSGRSLAIPIVPGDLSALPTADRELLAGYAASALGSMIGLKDKGAERSRRMILQEAIKVLAGIDGQAITVPVILKLIADRDPALVTAVGEFDDKLYKKLIEELQTLWLQHKRLLSADGEVLDVDALLGRDLASGKTRLSIISTLFLGDSVTLEFWVAQFLTAIGRWMTRRTSPTLQAVFLFDEADRYLPATSKPATKEPMENLLRRARSAGIGVFLGTQSPGDFDYRCRDNIQTWFVGRVTQATAIRKLQPMFEQSPIDVASKLPNQATGEFCLLREKNILSVKCAPSLLKTQQAPEERILELARSRR